MSIFSSGLQDLKKPDAPLYKAPKSVQQTMEIIRISEDGIFQVASMRNPRENASTALSRPRSWDPVTRAYDEKVKKRCSRSLPVLTMGPDGLWQCASRMNCDFLIK